MNIIVCDDNAEICKEIKSYINKSFKCNTSVCTNETDLLKIIENNNGDIQAVILDIVLENNINGIDVADKIHKNYPDIKIIFLTGYDDMYYQKIFSNFQPYGFIAKPIQYNILNFFLRKIALEYAEDSKCLEFVSNYKEHKILMKDICYIQSRKRVCEIVTEKEVFSAYLKISDMENTLTDKFIRCHQIYIVNRDFIKSIDKNQFVMKNTELVPISKKYYSEVKKYFPL